jgi:hypothetical protein
MALKRTFDTPFLWQAGSLFALGMEAGQQEHRNKDEYRGDEGKIHSLRYHVGENGVFGHDLLLEFYRFMMSSTYMGTSGEFNERCNQRYFFPL